MRSVTQNILTERREATKIENKRHETKRVNYVSEEEEEEEEEELDDEMVLQVDGDGKIPFMIEGLLCGNEFKAIIDTGSPVSIFPTDIAENCWETEIGSEGHD